MSAIACTSLCEQCNYAKQALGWRVRPITGPPTAPHTIETRTPTGHRHLSAAPALPTPARSRPPVSRLEIAFRNIILAG